MRAGLASCLVYVSWREILIRPFIPPTSENEPFHGATQRLYLSATLGHAGELERSFGRPEIARLPLPDGRSPRSGRRYFIFADLATGDPVELATKVMTAAGKALVLATSTDTAKSAAEEFNVNGWPVLSKGQHRGEHSHLRQGHQRDSGTCGPVRRDRPAGRCLSAGLP